MVEGLGEAEMCTLWGALVLCVGVVPLFRELYEQSQLRKVVLVHCLDCVGCTHSDPDTVL